VSSDRSQLAAKRTELENPGEHFILGSLISREPLGPVFVENDSTWRDVVSWAVFATIRAEELDVSSVNAAEMATATDDPNVRLLLGREGNLGAELGIDEDFALNIIQQVGNYEEIYSRNLGPDTPLSLDRGPNKAWNKGQGGVLSAPPFR
jgi:general L-amino acid transport system substrate-binding protein